MKKLISLIIVLATLLALFGIPLRADGETVPVPSADTETAEPPTDTETAEPPTDTETAEPPTDTETAEPPTDTETAEPPTDTETAEPPVEEGPTPVEEGTFGESFAWAYFEDGTLTVTGNGPMPDLDSCAAQPWRHLARSVKSVILSDGVTRVGGYAFAMMPALSSVTLPSKKVLDVIGPHAFEKCYSLKFIDMPSTVSRIEECAFSECWQLASVDLALNASYLNFMGDEAFAGCSSLRTLTLPRRLTHIGEGAFSGCSLLNGIKLPDKLTYLGRFAFQSCTSLRSVNVPYKLSAIPDYAFFGCSSLEIVTVGRGLQTVGREAFLWCPLLREIYLPAGVTVLPDYSIGYYYFNKEYVRYDGLTIITGSPVGMEYAVKNGFDLVLDEGAHVCESPCPYCLRCTVECEFYKCYEKCAGHTFPITGTVNDSISWSFSEDFVLTLEGTGDLPDFGFGEVPWDLYKDSVQKAVVGEGITSVGAFTFDSHRSLREVSLPDGLVRIGRKAFSLCSSLVEISLPEGLEAVEDLTFNGCVSLEKVTFGTKLASVGEFAFFGCAALGELILPEGVLSVGRSAFEGCASLSAVYIPSSVTAIGTYAFGYLFAEDRYYYKNEAFVIKAPLFSVAESYALENSFTFERSDVHECLFACEVCARCLDAECPYPECERKCDGVCTAPWDNPFTDVREKDWFSDSVRYVYLKGLFTGITNDTFVPTGGVTRAQLTVVLWRLAGSPAAEGVVPFEDCTASWYRDGVSWAYGAGVVTGKTATEFDPMGAVTREQMVTMLMRFCTKVLKLDTSARGDLLQFADREAISAYAEDAISWALAEGLLSGKEADGLRVVSPLEGATRAECATIFARFLKK